MKDNLSPEEKLLRLIKGHKVDPIEQINPVGRGLSEAKPITKNSFQVYLKKHPSLFSLQGIIVITFVFSSIYLIVSFIYPLVGFKKISLPKIAFENITTRAIESKPQIRPLEDYLKGIENRQVFGSITSAELTKQDTKIDIDLTKDINLVGIIAGDTPQAVIEDKKTQKTYYLTKGQFIGDFQIEDIQEGKVIISYKGERFELYL